MILRVSSGGLVAMESFPDDIEIFQLDAERIYVNVHTLYREFKGDPEPTDVLTQFAGMARLRKSWA